MQGFVRLKSRCWWAVLSSGGSTKEGPTSKLPQVVGRMHFLEAHDSLFLQSQQKNESGFFGASDFKEGLRSYFKGFTWLGQAHAE